MTGSNTRKPDIVGTPLGAVLLAIVVLGVLLVCLVLNSGGSSSDPFYDDSKELEAQDSKASEQVRDYERRQQYQERQDEYNDYLEWVNSGRP